MAKQKLTKAAISFIIEKREDIFVNNTFDDIAKLLKESFDIVMSGQGVGKSYHKYKNNEELKYLPMAVENFTNKQVINDRKIMHSDAKKKKVFEPINVIQNKGRDFDEDAGKKYNVNDFFIKKED